MARHSGRSCPNALDRRRRRYIVTYRDTATNEENGVAMTAMHATWNTPFGDREGLGRLGVALRTMAGRGHRFGPGPGGRGGPWRGPGDPGGRGPWGFPFFGGVPGGTPGPRQKARRGDVRTAALLLLAEEPRNGYQIMQALEERSEGMWRPSPGSVYPALQQLEDEGLIRTAEEDGRRVYHLTDAGRAYVAERPADTPAPWETFTDKLSDQAAETAALMRDVAMAFSQVMRAGSEAQVAQAGRVLADARRALYRILADGDPAAEERD